MKLLYLDFEFNGVSEPKLNLVSCAIICRENGIEKYRRSYWLLDKRNHKDMLDFVARRRNEGYVFVAFVMEAEARSLLSVDPSFTFPAIDLYLEYRCLLNRNNELSYGKQYIDGVVKTTKPPKPKWDRTEEDESEDLHHKPGFSLAAATYKLLGVMIDTKEKKEVRDIIIASDEKIISENRDRILSYNMSDVEHLPALTAKVLDRFKPHIKPQEWLKHALKRGEYAVLTAKMLIRGYPVNMDKVEMFTSNISQILMSAQRECVDADPTLMPFRFDKKQQKWVMSQKPIQEWVKAQKKPYWRKTAGGEVSLSKDAFNDWYNSGSEGFAGAYCRYLKTKQSLNGFMPNSKRGKFTDFVGTDNRVRPFFGIYGSQSSRSQPGSTGFIPLKAHWMRNFIEAKAGKALAGIDYSSQEFLIAAILSQDEDMMRAYQSGDVYLAFAKTAGLVPPDATKDTHKKMRDTVKALVLGISYDMSAAGLSARLTQVSGELVTEDKAQDYIDLFFDAYPDYADWKREAVGQYEDDGYLQLSDGWVMWGDNDNRRSVGNFPIQGAGAVVMREAVRLCDVSGVGVLFTLHDALYIEFDSYDISKLKLLMSNMTQAFANVMTQYGKTVPIMLEGEAWSVDYAASKPEKIDKVEYLTEYVDAKGKSDLDRYRQFFQPANLHKGIAPWHSGKSRDQENISSITSVQ